MENSPRIFNSQNEKLDVLVEGNEKSAVTIVMVHGFGTDKHETGDQFDYISHELADLYRIVRFDGSGFGKSEGKSEDFDYFKHAGDLKAVLDYVKQNYKGIIYIIAQSMGTFVTSLLNPQDIAKTVFMGIPNSNTEFIINCFVKRFGIKPGAVINFDGMSLVPRSFGAVQRIGPKYWKTLREFKPVQTVTEFSRHTKLLIIHPKQDEVVGNEFQEEYNSIPNVTIKWINGDHSFKKPKDRIVLIEKIKTFFT